MLCCVVFFFFFGHLLQSGGPIAAARNLVSRNGLSPRRHVKTSFGLQDRKSVATCPNGLFWPGLAWADGLIVDGRRGERGNGVCGLSNACGIGRTVCSESVWGTRYGHGTLRRKVRMHARDAVMLTRSLQRNTSLLPPLSALGFRRRYAHERKKKLVSCLRITPSDLWKCPSPQPHVRRNVRPPQSHHSCPTCCFRRHPHRAVLLHCEGRHRILPPGPITCRSPFPVVPLPRPSHHFQASSFMYD